MLLNIACCNVLLHIVMEEQDRGILPLSCLYLRTVIVPEYICKLCITYLFRIKIQLHRFRVVAKVTVSGVRPGAAGIADPGTVDASKLPEPGIGSPESTQCKGSCFQLIGNIHINRGLKLHKYHLH